MSNDVIITREIAPLPTRANDAHKGDVGRIVVIGGCRNESICMIGAPALAANAALRAGAGLTQIMVPVGIRTAVLTLTPTSIARALGSNADEILSAIAEFRADVIAVGPGLGDSLDAETVVSVLAGFDGFCVVDADGLNRVAELGQFDVPHPHRIIFTPHPGEAGRLLRARGQEQDVGSTPESRRDAALKLVELFGCTIVLKGSGTIVTNGDRLYTNETGNPGLATGGTGDVLTGLIAGLIGQKVNPFEASILGVYLHGLAGDYAAEELGRRSLTATDLLDYLPEAINEHEVVHTE